MLRRTTSYSFLRRDAIASHYASLRIDRVQRGYATPRLNMVALWALGRHRFQGPAASAVVAERCVLLGNEPKNSWAP